MKTTLCWSERPSSICESFLGFMSAKKHLQTVGVLTFSPHKQTEALVAKKTQLKKEKKTLLDWSYIWLWWHWHQSYKNPVSASAMLTGKFLQIWKVFATSSLLAEEFPDTLQIIWKVSGKPFFRFAKMLILDHHFFSSKLLKWDLALCLLSPFRVLKKLSQCLHGRLIPSKWFASMWSLMLFMNPSFPHTLQAWALLLLWLGSRVSLISIIDKTLASSSSRSEEKSLGTTTVLTRSVGHLLTMQAKVTSVKCLSSLISPKALCMLSWKSFHWKQSLSSICVSPKEQESQLRKVG